jgi:peptidoglycan/xylan/chitin deacetylase (PgdA/CDA1 family)
MNTKTIITISIILIIFGIYLLIPQTVPVLGYHGFYETYNDKITVYMLDTKTFDKQMNYLHKHHYHSLSMEEYNCWHERKCKIPRKSVLITMDDGYYNNYKYAMPILKKYDFNATMFYVGAYAESNSNHGEDGYLSLDQIKEAKKEYPLMEFYSHSYNMHDESHILTTLTKKDIENDFNSFKKIDDVKYMAYPYGIYNDTVKDVLKENNYSLAFLFGPNSKDFRKSSQKDEKYMIPRLAITSNMSFLKFKLRMLLPF